MEIFEVNTDNKQNYFESANQIQDLNDYHSKQLKGKNQDESSLDFVNKNQIVNQVYKENKEIDVRSEYSSVKSAESSINANSRSRFLQSEENKRISKQIARRKASAMKRKSVMFNAEQKRKSSDLQANNINLHNIMEQSKSRKDTFNLLRKKIKLLDLIMILIVLTNIVISIIDNEIYITNADKYLQDYMTRTNTTINSKILKRMELRDLTITENILRILNIVLVIISEILLVVHYKLTLRLNQFTRIFSKYDSILTSGLYKVMILEMILCLFCMPPYLNKVITGTMMGIVYVYNINSLFNFLVMLKSYFLIKIYKHYSRWTSRNAKSICKNFKVNTGINFAIKADLKKRPFLTVLLMCIVMILFCGFAIRSFEYGLIDTNSTGLKGNNDLQKLANCIWLVIVTMTTVGYGDFATVSHLGRGVGVLACIVGMLLISFVVVSLAILLEFSQEEKKSYDIIKKLNADNNCNAKAANVVQTILKLRAVNETKRERSSYQNITKSFVLIAKLKNYVSRFKNENKIANSLSLPIDQLLKNMETKLNKDLLNLVKCFKRIETFETIFEKTYNDQIALRKQIKCIEEKQLSVSAYLCSISNEEFISNVTKRKGLIPNSSNSLKL